MELISTKICKTSDIGVNDNLFGGTLLSWMDEAGGNFAASKCCTPNMVTVKINEVQFKKPVKVKEHIRIYGKVEDIGKTSIMVSIEARRVMFSDEAEESVCSTEMVFVKIDASGKASPINEKIRKKLSTN
ncbi:MAG: acyl-CoA thioesterase [Chlorobi bacterium]|nr:acyl-CoA thioesterase [Chlorobiota bacterium]